MQSWKWRTDWTPRHMKTHRGITGYLIEKDGRLFFSLELDLKSSVSSIAHELTTLMGLFQCV